MTKITAIVKRETGCVDRLRPVTIELHPFYVRLGVKGTREYHDVPWDHILDRARILAAQKALREKAALSRGQRRKYA